MYQYDDQLKTKEAHETIQLQPTKRSRSGLKPLIVVTIVTLVALGDLPELPMAVYGASFLGLLGSWIVGLRLLGKRRQTVLTETSLPSSQSAVPSSSLLKALRKHPLLSYFSIAYAIKFILLVPVTLAAWGIISGDWQLAFVIATFGPFAGGMIMTYATEGKPGLSRLKNRVRQWRIGWRWLLFAFAIVPALVMLGVIIQPGALAGFQGVTPILLVSYPLTYVAIWFGGGGLDEEVGWRGFALPRMQPRYGPMLTVLFLGVLHCFWHFEEFFTPAQGGGPGTGWTPFLVNLPIFLLIVISCTIILNWVSNRTHGSLFAAISTHTSFDAPQGALIPLFPAVGATSLMLGATIGLGVPALLILILTHGRVGYQRAPKLIS